VKSFNILVFQLLIGTALSLFIGCMSPSFKVGEKTLIMDEEHIYYCKITIPPTMLPDVVSSAIEELEEGDILFIPTTESNQNEVEFFSKIKYGEYSKDLFITYPVTS